jgi:hypothetical protein
LFDAVWLFCFVLFAASGPHPYSAGPGSPLALGDVLMWVTLLLAFAALFAYGRWSSCADGRDLIKRLDYILDVAPSGAGISAKR